MTQPRAPSRTGVGIANSAEDSRRPVGRDRDVAGQHFADHRRVNPGLGGQDVDGPAVSGDSGA
jgi:hypothetical protein